MDNSTTNSFASNNANHDEATAVRTSRNETDDPTAYIVPLHSLLEAERASGNDFVASVPMYQLFEASAGTEEKCIIIPMPGISSREIDYQHQHVGLDYRMHLYGTCFDCLMLARDAVALSAYTVHKAGSENFRRLYILWLFEDRRVLSLYPLKDSLINELWLVAEESECIARTTPLDGSEVLEYLEMVPSCLVPPRRW